MGAGPPMKARLARSGHSVSVIGHLLVASGGILRDISLYVDIVIMDLNTLAFIKWVLSYSSCMHLESKPLLHASLILLLEAVTQPRYLVLHKVSRCQAFDQVCAVAKLCQLDCLV